MTNMKMWTCWDGRKIRIKDLDDQHLMNIIMMLEKSHIRMKDIEPPAFQGEMAQEWADREWEALQESDASDYFPILVDLWEEVSRRNPPLQSFCLDPSEGEGL